MVYYIVVLLEETRSINKRGKLNVGKVCTLCEILQLSFHLNRVLGKTVHELLEKFCSLNCIRVTEIKRKNTA